MISIADVLLSSLSERVSPIALAQKIENGRFLYRKNRRAANLIKQLGQLAVN